MVFNANNRDSFEPFLTKESYTDTESESSFNEDSAFEIPQQQVQNNTNNLPQASNKQEEEKKSALLKPHASPRTQYMRWVPKKLAQSQKGSSSMWILKQPCLPGDRVLMPNPKQKTKGSASKQSKNKRVPKRPKSLHYTIEKKYTLQWIPKRCLQA